MALPVNVDRLHELHIASRLSHPDNAWIANPTNHSEMIVDPQYTTSLSDLFEILSSGICTFQNRPGRPGCAGFGVDWALTRYLIPAVWWCIGFMLVRYLVRGMLIRTGFWMGIGSRQNPGEREMFLPLYNPKTGKLNVSKKDYQLLLKYQNQVWLTFFYTASTIFGYLVQQDKPWFTFPISEASALHYVSPYPYNPSSEILLYYQYALGFYLSEMVSLLIETSLKRSDFIEYLIHHITTVALIMFSHLGWLHRFGAYVIFIHDASDILLSFGKSLHYIVESENTRVRRHLEAAEKYASDDQLVKPYRKTWLFRWVITDSLIHAIFLCFTAMFFYFRWYCLPSMMNITVRLMPKTLVGNLDLWVMAALLNGALQALHIYWGFLILLMIWRAIRSEEKFKDIRSDEDEEGINM